MAILIISSMALIYFNDIQKNIQMIIKRTSFVFHKNIQDMKSIIVGILVLTLLLVAEAAEFKKVVLEDKDALCLDGSSGAFYQYKGDPQKIMISFEGGGWCGSSSFSQTLQSCYQRSGSGLGSSKSYPETVNYGGLLANDDQNYFKNWTKFFLKYCDGTGHQGYRKANIPYKGKDLYFRGHNITTGQLNAIDATFKLFSEATHIVVTGQSAGGLATFLWTNYIADKAKGKVWSLPDSGIFLDEMNVGTNEHSYKEQFVNFMRYSNEQIDPPTKQCNEDIGKTQKWRCMFAENNHHYIKVPLFPIQSLYDSWSLPNILGVHCAEGSSLAKCNESTLEVIEQYHKNTSAVVHQIGQKEGNGYWAPICVNHVYSTGAAWTSASFRIPQNSAKSLDKCVSEWIEGEDTDYKHMDVGSWPQNKPCSGVKLMRRMIVS